MMCHYMVQLTVRTGYKFSVKLIFQITNAMIRNSMERLIFSKSYGNIVSFKHQDRFHEYAGLFYKSQAKPIEC